MVNDVATSFNLKEELESDASGDEKEGFIEDNKDDENKDEDEDDWGEGDAVAAVATADDDGKHCWVCFASEEDDPQAQWTHPCRYVLTSIVKPGFSLLWWSFLVASSRSRSLNNRGISGDHVANGF